MTNTVELNIPGFGSAEPPVKGKAIVTVNGVPIEAVLAFSFKAQACEKTECTLTFYASVEGILVVEDENFKFGTAKDLER